MKFTMQNTIFMLFYKLVAEKIELITTKKALCLNWLAFDQYKVTFFLIFSLKSSVNGWRSRFAEIRRYLASSSCPLANKSISAKGHFKRPFFLSLSFCVIFFLPKVCLLPLTFLFPNNGNFHLIWIFLLFPMVCSLIFMDVYLAVQLWGFVLKFLFAFYTLEEDSNAVLLARL